MPTLDTTAFAAAWGRLCREYMAQDQRKGQAAFNALHTLDPDLANMVRGTRFDPFYRDERVPDFLREVFG